MINYDKEIAKKLKDSNSSNEGALLNNDYDQSVIQIEFLEQILRDFRPKHIVETGTNKAYFCFICLTILDEYEDSVLINTFDIADFAGNCVDIVNKKFPKHKIIFNLGDSTETLREFNPTQSIDLFYVDGGHSFEVASSDIKNAVRLSCPLILIDDVNYDDIQRAIYKELGSYDLLRQTEEKDERKMVLYGLKK